MLQNNIEEINDSKVLTKVNYVEKREFDRFTLYGFDGSFQLLHTDVANLEFLAKSAGVHNYAVLIVDLCSSKVYVFPMRSGNKSSKSLINVQNKRKNIEILVCR